MTSTRTRPSAANVTSASRGTLDLLRPPWPLDPSARAYKDWLHLNVFDHGSGSVGLFNVSLHGEPGDERARAIGSALLHTPEHGWVGNVVVRDLGAANIGTSSIAVDGVALALEHPGGRAHLAAALPRDGLHVDLHCEAAAAPVSVERRLPFGDGWISWYVLPRLTVRGSAVVAGSKLDLNGASAYHDHNWGRWHWGDDVGWEWGAFLAPADGPFLVVSRATDRAHERMSAPMLVVESGAGRRRRFAGASVRLEYSGRLDLPLRRMPGALASLHQDRHAPALPQRVRVVADDGLDRVAIEFEPRAAAQLIAGDPHRRGYGFIHEMVGPFSAVGRVGDRRLQISGLGVFEHVD